MRRMIGILLSVFFILADGSYAQRLSHDMATESDDRPLLGLEKVCAQGHAGVCVLLGLMHQDGKGTKQDTERALLYYQKACDLKEPAGCDSYARLKNKAAP